MKNLQIRQGRGKDVESTRLCRYLVKIWLPGGVAEDCKIENWYLLNI
jgi:hypothetical protein